MANLFLRCSERAIRLPNNAISAVLDFSVEFCKGKIISPASMGSDWKRGWGNGIQGCGVGG